MYKKYGNVTTNWPKLGAETMILREPNMNLKHQWEYEDGLMLNGMYSIYKLTGEKRYLDYIKTNIDFFVDGQGHIANYPYNEFNLDNINNGKALLDLYYETKDLRYKKACDKLYEQLLNQPKTKGGSFWHKNKYPNQVWLDGIYMASVFYARYQYEFGLSKQYTDVLHQFIEAYRVTVDNKTGLCYHAYDETRKMLWSDAKGHSPHFWLRSLGWYVMAIVDVLEYLPKDLTGRHQLLKILNNLLISLRKVADPTTNLWYQIPDEGNRPLNYLESSGSLMVLNAIAKGIRKGYLKEKEWAAFLEKGWANALEQFISISTEGWVNVNKICHVGSLTMWDHKDGSYAYYMTEPIVANDHKGVGPFLMLSVEMAMRKEESL